MSGLVLPNEYTYQTIKVWAETEIEVLRSRLEDARLDEHKTTLIRGEVSRLRKLLALLQENKNV